MEAHGDGSRWRAGAPGGRPGGRSGPSGSALRSAAGLASLLVALGLAGCGGGGDDAASTAEGPASPATTAPRTGAGARGATDLPTEARADSAAAAAEQTATTVAATSAAGAAPAPAAPGAAVAVPPALQPIDIGRSMIFTAAVTMEVEDLAAASDGAMQAIAGLGGFLYGQRATSEPATSVLTFKVGPANFQEALARLGGLGTVRSQDVTTDDVTEQIVDLDSRILTSEVSVNRLRGMLEQANDVNALAALENELMQRETQLATLRGQHRTLQSQVDLATITLTLAQQAAPQPTAELTATASAGGIDATPVCPGSDELRIVEGARMTICYAVRNTGELPLSELRLDDPGLQLDGSDLRPVGGDPAVPLAPGASLVFAADVDASADRAPAPRLRAVALDAAGAPSGLQVNITATDFELTVEEDTSLPGFAAALAAGGRALAYVVAIVVVALGLLAPFVWVLPLAYVLVRWHRQRNAARRAARPPVAPPHGTTRPAQPATTPASTEGKADVGADAGAPGAPTS